MIFLEQYNESQILLKNFSLIVSVKKVEIVSKKNNKQDKENSVIKNNETDKALTKKEIIKELESYMPRDNGLNNKDIAAFKIAIDLVKQADILEERELE